MKKIIALVSALLLSASALLFAKDKTVMVETLNGKNEKSQVEVPFNPRRIAILDLAALDIIDNLGLGDAVAGCAVTGIDYLSAYSPDKNSKIKNIGNIKSPDMEALFACQPDVIFIGGRLSNLYDELSEIAPVVYLSTDLNMGLMESIKKNAGIIAGIFGKENTVKERFAAFDERIKILRSKFFGQSALLCMVTSGSCNLLGNKGRMNLLVKEIGFNNIGANLNLEKDPADFSSRNSASKGRRGGPAEKEDDAAAQAHGEESSFELIAKLNPSYIFVLDRDSAIGTRGAKLAKDIMNNELVSMTDAAKNGNLIILTYPAVWYTAEGGITALDYMLKDLEARL